MSQSKHTPGPWLVTHDEFDEALHITCASRLEGNYVEIARVSVGYFDAFEAEQHANASLIAAAPDLLTSAQDLVRLIRQVAPSYAESPIVAEAEAAISRAQGEQS